MWCPLCTTNGVESGFGPNVTSPLPGAGDGILRQTLAVHVFGFGALAVIR